MKKFVTRIFLFLLPVVIVAYISDGVITKAMRQYVAGDGKVWNDVIEGKLNSDIYIYGSSRAQNHFDPEILQDTLNMPVYNLGLNGLKFLMVKCRHDLAMMHGRKPKEIILSLDVTLLVARRDLFKYEILIPFINEPIVRRATMRYDAFDLYDYYLPMVRYTGCKKELKGALKYLFTHGAQQDDGIKRGYRTRAESWNGDFERERARNATYRAEVDSATYAAFEALMQEALRDSIRLVMVYSPEYYEMNSYVTNEDSIVNIYKAFAQKYNVPLLDYRTDTLCKSKTYFYNAMHMNTKGTVIFSRHLASDLRKLHEQRGWPEQKH